MKKLLLLTFVFMMPTTYGMARLRALAAQAQVYMPTLLKHAQPGEMASLKLSAEQIIKRVPAGIKKILLTKTVKVSAGLALAATGTVAGMAYTLEHYSAPIARTIADNILLLNQPLLIETLSFDKEAADILVESILNNINTINSRSIEIIAFRCSSENRVRIATAIKDNSTLLNNKDLMQALAYTTAAADVLVEGVCSHIKEINNESLHIVVKHCSTRYDSPCYEHIATAIKYDIVRLNDTALVEKLAYMKHEAANILFEGILNNIHAVNLHSIEMVARYCSSANQVLLAGAIKDDIRCLNHTELIRVLRNRHEAETAILVESVLKYHKELESESVRYIIVGASDDDKRRIAQAIKHDAHLLNNIDLVFYLSLNTACADILIDGLQDHLNDVHADCIIKVATNCSNQKKFALAVAMSKNVSLLNNPVLVMVVGSNSMAANILIDIVCEHKIDICSFLLGRLADKCSDYKITQITEMIQGDIARLNDYYLIDTIVRRDEKRANDLLDGVLTHIQTIHPKSAARIISLSRDADKVRIANAVQNNISLLNNHVIVDTLCSNEFAADILASAVDKNIDKCDDMILVTIGSSTTNIGLKNKLLGAVQQRLDCEEAETPSCAHIKQAGEDLRTMIRNHSYQLRMALQKEKQFHKEGVHCFYHGQESKWGLQQDLTHDIVLGLQQRGIVQDTLPVDFRYIMNKTVLRGQEIDEQAMVVQELQRHAEIYQGSTRFGGGAVNTGLLFVNKFAHGRVQEPGSYTAEYVKSNYNVKSNSLDFQSVFSALNIPSLHEKYKKELEALEDLHKQLFKSGRLLQICVPEAIVDDVVRMKYGGVETINHEKITTIPAFVEKVQKDPSAITFEKLDKTSEMVIPITAAYLLNPHSGIKIFTYDAEPTDKELHATYVAQRKALAEKIAHDAALHFQGKKFKLCCKSAAERLKEAAQAMR